MIELFNIDLLSYTVQTAETAPTHSYTIYWLILLGSMLLSWLVSARMKSRFSEYSQIPIPVTGRQVAEQMLKDNHITDVKVISTPGHLTDHYNPADKTVNLSESVYNSNSIAAAAVAALPTLATVPPAAFPLLIIPAPPAETIESAIDGTIKIPIPVTM